MRSHIQRLTGLRRGRLGLALGLGLAVLWGTVGAPSAAQGETLRWKFTPGETLHYTLDQKTVTTGKIPGGRDIKTTLAQTLDMTWTVKSVDSNGWAQLTQTIDRIRDQIDSPLVGSYTYDTKDPKEPEGLVAGARVPVFKALLGAAIPFRLSPLGEPADVKLPDSLAHSLRDLGAAAPSGGPLFSEEGLKEMIAQASLIVPKDDLAAGKTWSRQLKNQVPGMGTVVIDSTYRFEGPIPGSGPDTVKVTLANKVEIQSPAGAGGDPTANAGVPRIRSQKSEGSYSFDNAAGHLVGLNLSEALEVSSSVKIGLGNAAKDMEMTQIIETTTTRKLVK
jgi:hypothetical protein